MQGHGKGVAMPDWPHGLVAQEALGALFDAGVEPMLLVEAGSWRILRINARLATAPELLELGRADAFTPGGSLGTALGTAAMGTLAELAALAPLGRFSDPLPWPGETPAASRIEVRIMRLPQPGPEAQDDALLLRFEDVGRHHDAEEILRAREHRLEAILNHAVDGFIVIDTSRNVRTFNPAAAAMFGYRPEEVIGRNVNMLMPEPYHSEHDGYVQRYLDTGRTAIIGAGRRVRGRRKDGSVFPLLLSVTELPMEEERMFLGICRDITDQERYEAGLRRAKEAAESANRLKTDFLATMSHELRTPLNAVIGFAEIMRGQLFGALGARQYEDYIEDIHRSARHLLNLINDILDIARIEAGRLEFDSEPVDLAQLVEAEAKIAGDLSGPKGLSLSVDLEPGLPRIMTDASRLRQILINLLSNAVKFTPAGGSIDVRMRRQPGSHVQIAVSDTGIGIPKEALPHVTEPFYQVEGSRARHYGGSGLGLSIVKRLCEGLGASLAIDSALGRGTTVSVTLDLIEAPAALQSQPLKKDPDLPEGQEHRIMGDMGE